MYDTGIFDLYGTLVDIRTDENKEELWEKLSLFYAFYGAFYTPEELARSYKRLTGEMTAGHEELRRDSHEAFPEIRIEEVFRALFEEKGIAPDEPLVRHAGLGTVYVHSDISPAEDAPDADYVLPQMDMEQIRKILLS